MHLGASWEEAPGQTKDHVGRSNLAWEHLGSQSEVAVEADIPTPDKQMEMDEWIDPSAAFDTIDHDKLLIEPHTSKTGPF